MMKHFLDVWLGRDISLSQPIGSRMKVRHECMRRGLFRLLKMEKAVKNQENGVEQDRERERERGRRT